MDPKRDAGGMFLAPYTGGVATSSERATARSESRSTPITTPITTPISTSLTFPPVDQHIVQPEVTYDEIIRGRKVTAMTALHPHAEAQNQLAFVIAPHVKPGYRSLTELLTRAAVASDFGTDVCVCRDGIDPSTGSRYLEEISFEVVNEQSMRDITEKAEDLIHRGVRRVFGIFVKTGAVSEWSKAENKFVPMNKDGFIEDPLFVRPIAVKALVDFALSEDEVARALIVKGNSAIAAFKQDVHKQGIDEGRKLGIDEGRKQGIDEGALNGRRETLIEQMSDRFGSVPAHVENRIRDASLVQLRLWTKHLFSATCLEDVFVVD